MDKTFNQWLPECEADLRNHVQLLHKKHRAWRLGLESGDLFHDVVVKLAGYNHRVENRSALFGLVSKAALNRLRDLGRKQSYRGSFFSKPMPTRLRPLPGSSLETVSSKSLSPAEQAALNDQLEMIAKASDQDPQLGLLFHSLVDLTGRDESTSGANVAQYLDLPYKQVLKSMEKLRTVARRMI